MLGSGGSHRARSKASDGKRCDDRGQRSLVRFAALNHTGPRVSSQRESLRQRTHAYSAVTEDRDLTIDALLVLYRAQAVRLPLTGPDERAKAILDL